MLSTAWEVVGNKGPYQYILIAILCFLFIQNSFMIVGNSFLLMDPVFVCDGTQVSEDVACAHLHRCQIQNGYTLVSRMGLYCEREWDRAFLQSLLFAGSFLGLISLNYLADTLGRKFALLAALAVGCVAVGLLIVGGYLLSLWSVFVGVFCCGVSGYSLMIVSYIILADQCHPQLKDTAITMVTAAWSVGMCLLYPISLYMPEWYNMLVVFMLVPMLGILAVSSLVLVQSPSYYLQRKNKEKCTVCLHTIAMWNGKGVGVEEIREMVEEQKHEEEGEIWRRLCRRKNMRVIVCMAMTEGGGNLLYYGIQYAINDIGYSYGFNNLLFGACEFVVSLLMASFISRLNRKSTLGIVYFLSGVIGSLCYWDVFTHYAVLSCVLLVLLRVLPTIGYLMVVCIQTQSFPLQIQSTAAGLIQAFSQVGCLIAPLIVTFAVDHSINKVFLLSIVMLLLLIPLIFVPETKPNSNHTPPQIQSDQSDQSLISDR